MARVLGGASFRFYGDVFSGDNASLLNTETKSQLRNNRMREEIKPSAERIKNNTRLAQVFGSKTNKE